MKALRDYLRSVRLELSKVIWPKKDQVVRFTTIVLAISFIVGAYVGLLDYSFTKLLEYAIAR